MGPELVDIIKLSALAIIVTFIGILMKKADRETEFKVISLIALIFTIGVVATYIIQFFETVETMLTF
ncbi:MAG: hypothetical protein ACRCWY_09635 [Cellulosilyticaceae bacterium]